MAHQKCTLKSGGGSVERTVYVGRGLRYRKGEGVVKMYLSLMPALLMLINTNLCPGSTKTASKPAKISKKVVRNIISEKVTECTSGELERKIKSSNKAFSVVDFYAPWCGACTRMAPIFAEVAKKFPNVGFFKVDVSQGINLPKSLQLTQGPIGGSIPMLMILKGTQEIGRLIGARSEQQFINELAALIAKAQEQPEKPKKVAPATSAKTPKRTATAVPAAGAQTALASTVIECQSAQALQQLLPKNGYAVVDFYQPFCGPCKTMEPIFKNVAKIMSNVKFIKYDVSKAHVDPAMTKLNNPIMGTPTFVIFKDGREIDRIVGARAEAAFIEKLRITTSLR